jgi:hypothetical protein
VSILLVVTTPFITGYITTYFVNPDPVVLVLAVMAPLVIFTDVVIVTPIVEGCVDLEDLIDDQTWPDNVDPSGYINPVEEVTPSGFIKDPTRTEMWNL